MISTVLTFLYCAWCSIIQKRLHDIIALKKTKENMGFLISKTEIERDVSVALSCNLLLATLYFARLNSDTFAFLSTHDMTSISGAVCE